MSALNARQIFDRLHTEQIARRLPSLHEKSGAQGIKTGAVMTIAVIHPNDTFRSSVMTFSFGLIFWQKLPEYAHDSMEKFYRLHRRHHQEGSMNEFASSQSADPKNPDPYLRTYAGAIRSASSNGHEIYLSVAGLDTKADEALAYSLTKALGFKVSENYDNPLVAFADECLEEKID